MLLREGDERNTSIDIKLAAILSAVAGAMNSAGFHAFGLFSANMTGNASLLSDTLASGRFRTAALFLIIILVFILGAFLCSHVIERGRSKGLRLIYAYVIASEAVALAVLGGVGLLLSPTWASKSLVLGLSFLMGLQNAATTRISNARVRTTHISGMATDIGIGLAALYSDTLDNVRPKLRLYIVSIAAFVTGGFVGVLLYDQIGGGLLIAAGLMLFLAAMREVGRAS